MQIDACFTVALLYFKNNSVTQENNFNSVNNEMSFCTEDMKINNNNSAMNVVDKVDIQASNFYSSARSKDGINSAFIYNQNMKFDNLPPKLEMDYSRILNKPYFVNNLTWTTSSAALANIPIPSTILLNKLAKVPFEASLYYRAKVSAILQVAGTPMHMGTLIAGVVPRGFPTDISNVTEVNSLLCAPHAFLHANESTPIRLQVPFYVQGKFAAIDLDGNSVTPYPFNSDYAELRVQVLNALRVPTSGSNTLTVSVHYMFDELEFYVPHVDPEWELTPQGLMTDVSRNATGAIDGIFSVAKKFTGDILDSVRGGVRAWTGLHNPENTVLHDRIATQQRQQLNPVDNENYFEKLDPYSNYVNVMKDYVFDTDVDEMDMAYLRTKPQLIGQITINTATPAKSLLWSRPITPIQEINTISYQNVPGDTVFSNAHTNIHQTFAYLSKFWKGTIKIHLQAVMSNFHYCKIALARDYSPDKKMSISNPTFDSVTNLLSETAEFSAGGQIQTFELPFISPLNQLPCSKDFVHNALQHGVYYLYLYQPLVYNGSVSTSVQFNVYMSLGDDFDFFGYATDPLCVSLPPIVEFPEFRSSIVLENEEAELEAQATVFAEVSDQSALMQSDKAVDIDELYDMRPIKSTRDYVRRLVKLQTGIIDNTVISDRKGLFSFPVADLIGGAARIGSIVGTPVSKVFDVPSRNIISKMYYGFNGGTKFKILINGATIAEVWYVPPSYSVYPSDVSEVGDVWIGNEPINDDGSNVNGTIAQMFKFPEWRSPVAARRTASEYSTQTVSMDRPNYINALPGYILKINDEGTNSDRIAHACSEMEFTIPYMAPYRFVGDYTKFGYIDTSNRGRSKFATHDLGNIVIRIAAPENYAPGVTSQLQAVSYEIYAANTDEARYGYQVSAPRVVIPSYKVGNAYYQLAASIRNYSGRSPYSTMNGAPGFPLNEIRACYYTRS